METISYAHRFAYGYAGASGRFPLLHPVLSNPNDPAMAVQVDAYLDSGAERSLFQGWIARDLGLDLLSGRARSYSTTARTLLEARLHRVRLSQQDLGEFELEIGFATGEITRNLLGRDFFDLIQIGFRERHLTFYMTPTP